MDKEVPKKKKAKLEELETKGSKNKNEEDNAFVSTVAKERKETFESILDFNFNKKRVRILSNATNVPQWADGVVYWMFRDERVHDNWALLFAQKLALKNKISLHVCFCRKPKFLDATIRHFKFLLKGLEEVSEQCKKLNIEFHLLIGNGEEILPVFVEKNKIGAVVVDFMPLREPLSWAEQLKKTLPEEVPLCQVDAHNIVPTWIASDKLEYGARTIRGKITRLLPEFLTEFPPVIKHPYSGKLKAKSIDWLTVDKTLQVDRSVDIIEGLDSGYTAGMKTLAEFCSKRIKLFASKRNDPLANALSGLSPYFHFGQISVQRAILTVKKLRSSAKESVDAFVEEAVIRRELADNFCFYNPKYDSIDGTNDWAKKTLNDHRKDKRTHIYTRSELEESKTHDDLWNSAQIQLVKEGKMHGFLRMYWAKKILEWTPSPEEALAITIYLNDRYSMDGRDPNGFVGCMWSICGIHDQGWKERDVFGKIRYMNYAGCQRKFNVPAFVARYGGKVHKYIKK